MSCSSEFNFGSKVFSRDQINMFSMGKSVKYPYVMTRCKVFVLLQFVYARKGVDGASSDGRTETHPEDGNAQSQEGALQKGPVGDAGGHERGTGRAAAQDLRG